MSQQLSGNPGTTSGGSNPLNVLMAFYAIVCGLALAFVVCIAFAVHFASQGNHTVATHFGVAAAILFIADLAYLWLWSD